MHDVAHPPTSNGSGDQIKTPRRISIYAIAGALLIMLAVLLLAWAAGHITVRWIPKTEVISDEILKPYQAKEQQDQNIAFMALQESARRHLTAVRTDAKDRPDSDLAHDIAVYAGTSKSFFRKDQPDETPKLADLRVAMDNLRPLDGNRVSCPPKIRSETDKRCRAYFEALEKVFGPNL